MLGKHKQVFKLFIVLFFSTSFIFGSSHFGAKAFNNISNSNDGYVAGTTVGTLDISGKTESEVITLLEEKYVEWVKNTKIELKYSEKIVPFDVNLFYFDAAETVTSLKDGQNNPANMTIDLLEVEEQIQLFYPQVNTQELELTKLTTDLTDTASKFETGSFIFNLNTDYAIAGGSKKDTVIGKAIIQLAEMPSDLDSIIVNNPEIKIAEEATFSLLDFAKQQKIETSSSLGIIGTGIYQAILPTNFSIVERNTSNVLPKYSVLGMEAKINLENGADLVIINPNKMQYTLELSIENSNFIVTLKGEKFLYDYKIIKKDEKVLKPKTIIQYSPLVLPGKIKVENDGADGKIVKVYREIYQGSQLVESQFLSEDYYAPVYRVEVYGLVGIDQQGATQNTNITSTDNNPNGNQTPSTSEDSPNDSDDDLWGKQNEQPK